MSLTQNGTLNGGGTPTILTDQANGLLLVDNGSTPQEAQRPILEAPILANNLIDPSADWFDMWDVSAARMVRVSAMRASQLTYKADGLNDTRAGDLGSINSGIYAVHDHIHPILAITAPTTPVITLVSGTMTITPILISTTITEEEGVTFQFRVQCNIPVHTNVWQAFSIPSIAGFKVPVVTVNGTYRQNGNPTGYPLAPVMGGEASLWGGNTIYVGSFTENVATTRYVHFNVKYVIA